DDDKINKVLSDQYERAFDRHNRDEMKVFMAKRELASLRGDPWDAETFKKEKAAFEEKVQTNAKAEGLANMQALRNQFNKDYYADNFGLDFEKIVDLDTQGQGNLKAKQLIAAGGFLTPAQEVEFAVRGAGTDED